jgi:TfoX-like protein
MGYDTKLADRIREHLSGFSEFKVEEKKMFRGLTFMVNDKMCISVSGQNLMCRFDPTLQEEVAEKIGYKPMIMRGKEYQGYCYVEPIGFHKEKDFKYWLKICLDFNKKAQSSKRKK